MFRILKSAALNGNNLAFLLSSYAPFIIQFHPHAVCIAKNFPAGKNVVKKSCVFLSISENFGPNLA